jgi:nicotinamide-nucleotide amidase
MTDNAHEVIQKARASGLQIAVAESLTGGMVSSALVDVPGASEVFRGSVVAYNSLIKNQLLGVDAALLATSGPVCAEVASAMAEGAGERFGADIAVATTGVAGPDPDPMSGQAPGVVFIAVSGTHLGTIVREIHVTGDRADIRAGATRAALQALSDALSMRE